jgi:hypothetical protein
MLGIDPGTLLFQVLDLLSLPVQQYKECIEGAV